jgi:filamentous hemagglutinin family protein
MSDRVRSHKFDPLLLAALLTAAPVQAQIVTDGSVGPKVSLRGGEIEIGANLGTRRGDNLFHSFEKFGIAPGQTAIFTGPGTIRNVISRVTGGEVSNIDGTLRSTVGQADLYFVNPAGVMFGPNARLDVPEAFHVSTAHELRLSDGTRFSAMDKTGSGLTVASPEAFGFLDKAPGRIVVNASNLIASKLSLIGGDIDVNGSDPDNGNVTLNGSPLSLSSAEAGTQVKVVNGNIEPERMGTIRITNSANIGGPIRIRAGTLVLENSTIYISDSEYPDTAVDLQAKSIDIGSSNIIVNTVFPTRSETITITADNLKLRDFASINSGTYSDADGGNVIVRAGNLSIIDSGIYSDAASNSTGHGGRVDIVSDTMELRDGGVISSGTAGPGNAGAINVQVGHLLISDGAITANSTGSLFSFPAGSTNPAERHDLIAIVPFSELDSTLTSIEEDFHRPTGTAGQVTIKANTIELRSGGLISSSTSTNGNAGIVDVQANRLLISGDGAQAFTGIISSAEPTYSIGSITKPGEPVNFPDESLLFPLSPDDAVITLTPTGHGPTGAAGRVTVKAEDAVELRSGGMISSSTATKGNAGTIDVQTGHLLISGDSTQRFTGITSATEVHSTGAGGAATIHAQNILLERSGSVTVASEGSGSGGSLNITAADTLQLNNATLAGRTTADVDVGDAKLEVGRLLHLRDSTISTEGARGGNILMQAPLLLLEKSKILSKAQPSEGGNLRIEAGQIIRTPDSRIEASGNLTITAPNTDVSGSLTVLPETLVDASSQLRVACAARGGRPASSFTAGGRGSLPPDPDTPLAASAFEQPLGQQTATGSPTTLTARPSQAAKLITVSGIPQPVLGSPRLTCRG